MKIYDISQEAFSCCVWPGDPAPRREVLCDMEKSDLYNLTAFSMCAHNGTHVDAPRHFIADGKTVEQLALNALVGYAYVAEHQGTVDIQAMAAILKRARDAGYGAEKRILIKGQAEMSLEAAELLAKEDVLLFGNESQTVGPENAPMPVHKVLLGADVVLLEGVRLGGVPEGVYILSAAPLNLAGAEGAPCRALLIDSATTN